MAMPSKTTPLTQTFIPPIYPFLRVADRRNHPSRPTIPWGLHRPSAEACRKRRPGLRALMHFLSQNKKKWFLSLSVKEPLAWWHPLAVSRVMYKLCPLRLGRQGPVGTTFQSSTQIHLLPPNNPFQGQPTFCPAVDRWQDRIPSP